MTRKVITPLAQIALVVGIVFGLIQVLQAANIDPTDKWAWGTNIGWINFNPTHGGGVTVYDDHLEGYVWAENVGWIRLGTHTGGSPHTYANTSNTNEEEMIRTPWSSPRNSASSAPTASAAVSTALTTQHKP